MAQAPRQGNKAKPGGNLDRVLNLRGPVETAQLVDTRAAVPRGQTAPVVLRAVLVAAELVVPGVALVVVEEAVEVVGVRAGVVAAANANVQNGDQAQE